MQRTGEFLGAWIAVALVLAGCGGPDTSSAPTRASADGQLLVVAKDISFPADHYEADGGPVDVSYENDGSITHTLVIDDVDDFKLTVKAHGDSDEATIDLAPGTYTLYCDVPGHRQAGMEATLTVS